MVINLHITSKCNYQCRFCFAGFQDTKDFTLTQWQQVVDNIATSTDTLTHRRINLAGGEPTLMPGFAKLCRYIRQKGFEVSFITNGYWLRHHIAKPEVQEFLQREITMVGLSIDSLNPETMIQLGRTTRTKHLLTLSDYQYVIDHLQRLGIQLKINTVVTQLNAHESLAPLLVSNTIQRFKILRMSAIDGENNQAWDLLPTDTQFTAFVARHAAYQPIVEDDNEMQGSYIFVNPQGQLVDNSQGEHQYQQNLLEQSFTTAFANIQFNQALYEKRYGSATTVE